MYLHGVTVLARQCMHIYESLALMTWFAIPTDLLQNASLQQQNFPPICHSTCLAVGIRNNTFSSMESRFIVVPISVSSTTSSGVIWNKICYVIHEWRH